MNIRWFERIEHVLFSHAVSISVLLYLLTVFVFELTLVCADNMFFSSVLHRWQGGGDEHMIHVSYLLSYPLAFFSELVPSIDFFTIYIHLCNLAAVVCLAYGVVRTNDRPGISHYVGWLLIIAFMFRYSLIGAYPIASFAAMSGGLVLITKSIKVTIGGGNIRLIFWGVVAFFMGCILRYDSCVGIVPFIALGGWFAYRRRTVLSLAACFACLVLVAICYFIQSPLSSVDYGFRHVVRLTDMNVHRMKFCDYEDDSGVDKAALYQKAGCSDNDLSLYGGFIFQQDKCFDEEYWAKLGEIRDSGRKTFSIGRAYRLLRYSPGTRRLLLPSFVVLLLLLLWRSSRKPQNGDYVILCAFCCYALLLMRGRLNLVSSLAIMQPCLALWSVHMPERCCFRFGRRVMALLMIYGTFWALCGLPYSRATFPSFGGRWADPALTGRVEDECRMHKDYTYFAEAHFWRHIALPYSSIRSADLKRCPNFYPYDSWQVFFPSYQASLRQRGLKSPSELLLSDKVRFILRADNVDELDKMKGKDWLVHRLGKNFDCVRETDNIRLKLVADKKLSDGLYVVRVVRDVP